MIALIIEKITLVTLNRPINIPFIPARIQNSTLTITVLLLNTEDLSRIQVTDMEIITAAHPAASLTPTHRAKNAVVI